MPAPILRPSIQWLSLGAPLTIGVGWGLVIYTRVAAGRLGAAWWKVRASPACSPSPSISSSIRPPPRHTSRSAAAPVLPPHFPGADGAGLWVWCLQDYPRNETFGVPIFNYITWFLMVCYFTLAYRAVAQRRYESCERRVGASNRSCGAVLVIATVLLVITLGIVVKFLEWTGIPHVYVLGFMVGLAGLSLAIRRDAAGHGRSRCLGVRACSSTRRDVWGLCFTDAIPGSPGQSWFVHTNLLCWALVMVHVGPPAGASRGGLRSRLAGGRAHGCLPMRS